MIVSREWDDEEAEIHIWLRSLTNESEGKELKGILRSTNRLSQEHRWLVDGVMEVFTRANRELIRKVKEEPTMCEAINELFAEETKKEKERADAAIKRAEEAEEKTNAINTELGETKAELGETKAELGETKTKLDAALAKIDEMAGQLQDALKEIAHLKEAAS